MNDSVKIYPSRLTTRIFLFGLGLVISLAGVVLLSWFTVVEPQIRSNEQTKIDLLVPLYAQSIASILLIPNQQNRLAELDVWTSEILVTTDLITQYPMFEGLQVELSDGTIIADFLPDKEFSGFVSQALLVSQKTGKALGLLRLFYSSKIFEHTRESAIHHLALWSCFVLVLLIIFWRLLIKQIEPLINLSTSLQGWTPEKTERCLTPVSETASVEIIRVQHAIDGLMHKMFESKKQIQELANHIEKIREHEKKKIAGEIHDELGSLLTKLNLDLTWLRQHHPRKKKELNIQIDEMFVLLDQMNTTVHNIAHSLRPKILDEFGITAALEWLIKETNRHNIITCYWAKPPPDIELDEGHRTALFRICQEALTNVVRHAQAKEAKVLLQADNTDVVLEVVDDGRGINSNMLRQNGVVSFGVDSMRERVLSFGGEFILERGQQGGTKLLVRLPLPKKG